MDQTQADLRASAARAEAMSRLMAVAGHDLKQPLQVALMSIARAASEGLQPRVAARLEIALAALTRLGCELDDLARTSACDTELKPHSQSVSLLAVFRSVEQDWRVYAEACGVKLRFRARELCVQTDPAMLRTILRNLVGNAVKYGGRGGRVVVGCRAKGDEVAIEIHDNGCGISSARLATIFNAFERGDRAGCSEGLGLGLHIVRLTANLLGHPLSVRSVEGQGSVFSITLPREPSERRLFALN